MRIRDAAYVGDEKISRHALASGSCDRKGLVTFGEHDLPILLAGTAESSFDTERHRNLVSCLYIPVAECDVIRHVKPQGEPAIDVLLYPDPRIGIAKTTSLMPGPVAV